MPTSIFGHTVDLGIESGVPISDQLVKFLDALKIGETFARQGQGEEGNCSEYADCGVQFDTHLYHEPCLGFIVRQFPPRESVYEVLRSLIPHKYAVSGVNQPPLVQFGNAWRYLRLSLRRGRCSMGPRPDRRTGSRAV